MCLTIKWHQSWYLSTITPDSTILSHFYDIFLPTFRTRIESVLSGDESHLLTHAVPAETVAELNRNRLNIYTSFYILSCFVCWLFQTTIGLWPNMWEKRMHCKNLCSYCPGAFPQTVWHYRNTETVFFHELTDNVVERRSGRWKRGFMFLAETPQRTQGLQHVQDTAL